MILHNPAIDWLTLTAFDANETIRLANISGKYGTGEPQVQKILGYSGRQWRGIFFGVGVQNDMRHVMLRASGEVADTVMEELVGYGSGRCTRIDLQITVYLPLSYSARLLADRLRMTKWKHYKRMVELIEGNPAGFDTVYIGSRKSERFIRIYVKKAGVSKYLRFEVEYKGDFAQGVYDTICARGKEAVCATLAQEVNELPEVTFPGMETIRERIAVYEATRIPRVERVPDDNPSLMWLLRQVDPAIRRLIHDHDTGVDVRKLVAKWHELGQEIDNPRDLR